MESLKGLSKAVAVRDEFTSLIKRADKLVSKIMGNSMSVKSVGAMNSEDIEMLVECTKVYNELIDSLNKACDLVVTQQQQLDSLQESMAILLERTKPKTTTK